ncbi:Voltage-gated H(+)/2Cl(-) exchange transporter ClcA, partial [hydrothermal vent metagenome]
ANIGKMVNNTLGLSEIENNALISTGAAAGLASAFNAPFAGIIFIIEEMHGHFRFNFYS